MQAARIWKVKKSKNTLASELYYMKLLSHNHHMCPEQKKLTKCDHSLILAISNDSFIKWFIFITVNGTWILMCVFKGGYELNRAALMVIALKHKLVIDINCGCGGRLKVPAGQHHYQGIQSEKHPEACSCAPWGSSAQVRQARHPPSAIWGTEQTYGVKANPCWLWLRINVDVHVLHYVWHLFKALCF